MPEFEFLGPNDKPALLGITNPELQSTTRAVLQDLEYKVHTPVHHAEFMSRFSQFQYHIVVLDELFDCENLAENFALQNLQTMPMSQRRHAAILLLGDSFKTLNTMQAYHQSVHAVVNRQDIGALPQFIQQILADNNLFLNVYRDSQMRLAQGKA